MDFLKLVSDYKAKNEQEEKDRQTMIMYHALFKDILTRNNEIAHVTCSAWVVNKDRTKVLMVYHNIYNAWCWTGGHADGDSNFIEVTRREVQEETGLKNVRLIVDDIISLECISVKGHMKRGKYVSSHIHLNLTFLFEADDSEKTSIKTDENSGVKWIKNEDVLKESNERWMCNVYQKIMNRVKEEYCE